MPHRFVAFAAVPALAAAGILAALTLAAPAKAWDVFHLPPGWSYEDVYNVLPGNCEHAVVIRPPGQIGPSFCLASSTWQADLDAWVTANYTAPATTTAPGTISSTTTEATTTSTEPTSTQPTPGAAPPAPATDYQAQIDDLKSQIAALKLRVDRLEAAADAEWLAYHDALASGVDPVIASMIARQAGYDLIHGTGAFAP